MSLGLALAVSSDVCVQFDGVAQLKTYAAPCWLFGPFAPTTANEAEAATE